MKTTNLNPLFTTVLFFFFLIGHGQELPSTYKKTILKLDSLFWTAYNSCDVDKFPDFLTKDLEFYHDKGGLTRTSAKLVEQVKNGLCGNENIRLRREAVEGSVQVFL